MKKTINIIIVIVIMFSLSIMTSCKFKPDVIIDIDLSSTIDEKKDLNYLDEYELTLQIGDEIGLNTPMGIAFLEDNLIVADSGNHRLVVIDTNGNFIKEIGKQGKSKVEFFYPMGVAVDDENNIYVVDSGNCRVQILDSEGNYKKEYVFEDFKKKSKSDSSIMNDIVVINGVIYVSVDSRNFPTTFLYRIRDDKLERLADDISGYLTTDGSCLYFVSANELPEENTIENLLGMNGIHHLIKIDENNTVDVIPLPKYFYPMDICFNDEELYIICLRYLTIERFDLDGSYIGTIYRSDNPIDFIRTRFIAMDKDKSIYLSGPKNNSLYKLERKK